MVILYYYGFQVNGGICLISIIQTFQPPIVNVTCSFSCILNHLHYMIHYYSIINTCLTLRKCLHGMRMDGMSNGISNKMKTFFSINIITAYD